MLLPFESTMTASWEGSGPVLGATRANWPQRRPTSAAGSDLRTSPATLLALRMPPPSSTTTTPKGTSAMSFSSASTARCRATVDRRCDSTVTIAPSEPSTASSAMPPIITTPTDSCRRSDSPRSLRSPSMVS